MKRSIIETAGGKLVYRESDSFDASRETVFFLHGMTADHTMFEPQLTAFENRYNLIAWDAPAHGESRPFTGFSFDASAEYMAEILDRCGTARVFLVGQSLGGYFAQAFIRKYPDRVKGFISIGSTPFGHAWYSKSDVWILKQVEWMAMLYPLNLMKKVMAEQVAVTQRGRDNMTEMLTPYGKKELCHLMGLGYSAFLAENSELDIPCPVLLVIGEHDRTGKVMTYNRMWTEATGYRLEVIKDAAHNANVDRPDIVNALIGDFIASVAEQTEKGEMQDAVQDHQE